MSPDELLEQVHDRDSFFAFVAALAKERRADAPGMPFSPTQAGWENTTIENFLDAALACATARQDRTPAQPSWKAFAEFLYGGKIYE